MRCIAKAFVEGLKMGRYFEDMGPKGTTPFCEVTLTHFWSIITVVYFFHTHVGSNPCNLA